jgi:hypothetical protein
MGNDFEDSNEMQHQQDIHATRISKCNETCHLPKANEKNVHSNTSNNIYRKQFIQTLILKASMKYSDYRVFAFKIRWEDAHAEPCGEGYKKPGPCKHKRSRSIALLQSHQTNPKLK